MRGRFIVVEGVRGCGKSTLAKAAHEKFGITVVEDLSYLPFHRKIRDLFLREGVPTLSRLALSYASRVDLQENVIRPALLNGDNVLCERWYHSTEAYLLYPNELGPGYSSTLREVFDILEPDLTVIRSVDWEVALERLHSQDRKPNIFEKDETFMKHVCDFYNGYCDGIRADTLEIGLGHIRELLEG